MQNLKENTKLPLLYEKKSYSMSIYQHICLEPQICWLTWKLLFIHISFYKS